MKLRFWLGLCLFLPVALSALLSLFWTPADPFAPNPEAVGLEPSDAFWLGTDVMGRDLLSRLMLGARTALGVALIACGIGLVLALPLGLLAGSVHFIGGLFRLVKGLVWTCPVLILVMILTAGGGLPIISLIAALALWNTACFAESIERAVRMLWQQPFIQSARDIGEGPIRIAFRHVLPNVISLIAVGVLLRLSFCVMAEATVSYLGLGIGAGMISWGAMLNEAGSGVTATLVIGGAITLTLLGLNLMAAGLRLGLPPRQRMALIWT